MVEAVTKEFTPARTGIYFTGFKDCEDTPNPDVVILRAAPKIILFDTPSFRGRAVIGQDGEYSYNYGEDGVPVKGVHGEYESGFYKKSGKVAHVALKSINPGTVIHEFGHVAGLRHEHIHEEAKYDPNCSNRGVAYPTEEKFYDSAHVETNYDSRSIMNYCFLQTDRSKFNNMIGNILSSGDMQTLRAYY